MPDFKNNFFSQIREDHERLTSLGFSDEKVALYRQCDDDLHSLKARAVSLSRLTCAMVSGRSTP